jgi:hypothetical protein
VLYGIACAKDAFATAHFEILGGSNKWNISFARAAYDWRWISSSRSTVCCIQLE